MAKKKLIIASAAILLGSLGCGGSDQRTSTTTTTSSSTDTRTLRDRDDRDIALSADRNPRVARFEERQLDADNWQQVNKLLAREGYNPGSVAPPPDSQTRRAIADYQRRHQLSATGVLDGATLVRMQEEGAGFTGSLKTQMDKATEPRTGED